MFFTWAFPVSHRHSSWPTKAPQVETAESHATMSRFPDGGLRRNSALTARRNGSLVPCRQGYIQHFGMLTDQQMSMFDNQFFNMTPEEAMRRADFGGRAGAEHLVRRISLCLLGISIL